MGERSAAGFRFASPEPTVEMIRIPPNGFCGQPQRLRDRPEDNPSPHASHCALEDASDLCGCVRSKSMHLFLSPLGQFLPLSEEQMSDHQTDRQGN